MPEEETKEESKEEKEGEAEERPKKRRWFAKIPKDTLFSPGGMILVFFALFMEISDLLIPPSGIDSLVIELLPEIIFCAMLKIIAGVPFVSQIIPLIIERIPVLSDIIPTWFAWLLRMFF